MFKKILTANRADYGAVLAKLELCPMEAEEPLRAYKVLEAVE